MRNAFLLLPLLLGFPTHSESAVIKQVESTYKSGATFKGLVTFLDDFTNVSAVDGILSGGVYGHDHISWIWDPSFNNVYFYGPNYGSNYLMDGTGPQQVAHYRYFITFTWEFTNPAKLVFSTPAGDPLQPLGGNNIGEGTFFIDPIVSGAITDVVPEPNTFAFFGVATAAVIGCRMRKR